MRLAISVLSALINEKKGRIKQIYTICRVYSTVTNSNPLYTLYANMSNSQSINYDDGFRLQALALIEYGITFKIVAAVTEISRQTISRF